MVSIVEIRSMLENTFKNSNIIVEDTMGDGYHFEVSIVSDLFEGKAQQDRHKMVYDALLGAVGGAIHALSVQTRTFDEAKKGLLGNEKTYEPYVSNVALDNEILKKIDEAIKKHDVILFMKGTKTQPMCGFSATVCNILKEVGVDFMDVNVLASSEIRDNIKIYSNWNTIPQLFIKGYFVGGCDITMDMYKSGELLHILKEKNVI